jgi:hypothetical protein
MFKRIQKKVKIQDSTNKTSLFFGTLSLGLWAILATWLHLGTLQKLNLQLVVNIELLPTYTELEFDVLGLAKSV